MSETQIGVRLLPGDCVVGMAKHLGEGEVDVVVTSPPYNLGIDYGVHDDRAPRDEYLAWCEEWALGVKRVLSTDGSFFLNVGGKPTDPYVPFDVLSVMRRHFVLQNTIHWIKSISIMRSEVGDYPGLTGDLSVGHYKPINSPRFVNDCHEYIFHLTHSGNVGINRLAVGVPYRDKSNIGRWKSAASDVHCRGNTWFLPIPRSSAATVTARTLLPSRHPLPERCLMLHGVGRVRMALDPFMGLGSTALACVRLGVPCVGFEIDPEYRAESERRLAAARAQCPLPIEVE